MILSFHPIYTFFLSGNKTILHAATRIEVATLENTNILRNVSDDLKSISSFLNQEKKASSQDDFSEINETFPVKSLEEFDAAEMKLSHETNFKDLFVSVSSIEIFSNI